MVGYKAQIPGGLVAVNGEITALADAKISVSDRGFLFADSVFETLVAFRSVLIDPEPHFARLRQSAEKRRMTVPWSNEELRFEIDALLDQLNCLKTQIRLVISRGNGFGLGSTENLVPTKVVFALPSPSFPAFYYETGIALKTFIRKSSHGGVKQSDYSEAIVAMELAKKENFQDILWLSPNQEFVEASTANIFFVSREGDSVEIATPPLNSGALGGTTRTRLKNLLENAKIKVTERSLDINELARFDEAFLTSSVRGLIPVNQIDTHKMSTARDKSVYRQIERLHLSWLESLLGQRVSWNTGEKDDF